MKQNSTKKQSGNNPKVRNRIIRDLEEVSSRKRATNSSSFFKTGKGEYGEGDMFIGIKTSDIRKISKSYLKELALADLDFFLQDKIHEYRLFALISLTYMYERTKKIKNEVEIEKQREKIYHYYLKNRGQINNWDLVDVSAPKIIGEFLKNKSRNKEKKVLYDLVKSDDLWEQRIAIL